MVTIKGLDKLQRNLDGVSRALKALDGDIATVKFDPDDAASVNNAIAEMERAIDAKVVPYGNNDMVRNIVTAMKTKYRDAILDKVREAQNAA